MRARPKERPRALALLALLVFAGQLVATEALAENGLERARRVLILYEEGISHPAVSLVDDGIRAGLAGAPFKIDLYREYLDADLFPDPAAQKQIREFYIRKYSTLKPDLIITAGPSPLKFVVDYQRVLSGIPVVFYYRRTNDRVAPASNFTGIVDEIDSAGTLAAALHLLPRTKQVFVVGGTTPFDRFEQTLVRNQLEGYESHIAISYLFDLSMPALLERLRHLPARSVVLLTSFAQDAAGTRFIGATQSAPLITAASSAPVFSLFDVFLNHGEVGGRISNLSQDGKNAGALALRILKGEKPQEVRMVPGALSYVFDWRALQRWGLAARDLPAGSILLNRQPSVWESYKRFIIGVISLILVETSLIMALLWQRKRRQSAEDDLAKLSGRLIEAQDLERRRIAREIHDDYSQRLAIVAMDLEQMAGSAAPRFAVQLNELWSEVSELGADLHSLSHGLHSSALDRLGLEAGAKTFCQEFSAQQGIQIDFQAQSGMNAVSADRSLCLFRVLQEALRNTKRHSGATKAEVRLDFLDHKVHLSVADEGKGFDPKARATTSGIGVRSMEERVRSLQGHFEIQSRPTKGTRVEVWLPIEVAPMASKEMTATQI